MALPPAARRDREPAFQRMRSGGRVVEGARLESEYTPKAYRGFESLPLRHLPIQTRSPMTAQSRGFLRII